MTTEEREVLTALEDDDPGVLAWAEYGDHTGPEVPHEHESGLRHTHALGWHDAHCHVVLGEDLTGSVVPHE